MDIPINKPVQHYPCNTDKQPVVSVCVQTYQHVNYISQCLDGVLIQKTDFHFEILLGEDASTDGTREICIDYAEKHPDKIRLFLHHRENNIKICGQPTGRFNFLYNLSKARGKYIALCEGDDYWTDPYKLQKQVDFLEKNEGYSSVFHDSIMLIQVKAEYKKLSYNLEKTTFDLHDILLRGRFIQTNSFVFRTRAFKLPTWFNSILSGDQALVALVANNGLIKYLPTSMGVYRKNSGGISKRVNSLYFYKSNIHLYSHLKNEISPKYYKLINRQILKWHGHSFLAAFYLKKPFVAIFYFLKGLLYTRSFIDINYYFKDFLFDIFRKKKKITIF